MPIDELASRRPTLYPDSVPVTLADGQPYLLPRGQQCWRPHVVDGKLVMVAESSTFDRTGIDRSLTVPLDDAMIAVDLAIEKGDNVIGLALALAVAMISFNYAIPDEQLASLVYFGPVSGSASESMIANVIRVARGAEAGPVERS